LSLRDAFASVDYLRSGVKCRTCAFTESLSPDDRVMLEEYFADPGVTSSMIVRALKAFGFSVSLSALSRHRRECR
jgi:hypothetical protein